MRQAVQHVRASPENATPDLGGSMTTSQLGQAIVSAL